MKTDQTYFFPWVRKGLANNIPEADVFGNVEDNDALAKMRAVLTIHTQYKSYPTEEDGEEKTLVDEKEIGLYGPADVASLSTTAILKRRPEVGSSDFPIQYFPYIEFREADLPWRYTPAQRTEERLTPWMALLCFRTDKVSVFKDGKGLPILTFRGEKALYEATFPRMDVLWKTAHAQGPKKTVPTISRIISLRGADPETGIIPNMDEDTEYIACLVPTYEVGRLRGLGESAESLASITAQTPAWVDYDTQKGKLRGMEFPVYYSWTFTTGGDSFEGLVEHLKITTSSKAGVTVDVTRMGNGFDYDVLKCKSARPSIVAPAATRPPLADPPVAFPASNAKESKLSKNLENLLSCNPVFLEDAKAIGKKPKSPDWGEFHDPFDDPCVTPPVYGARHVLATSLHEEGHEWISDLNLDINYRIAAGLGRKVIIENQEVLMDRAWKQVEAVQALNMQLYRRLLSIGANNSLRSKTVEGYGEGNKYLASLMFYLSSMKEAADKNNQDLSLASVLTKRDVPTAFATATFHRMADRVAKVVSGLSTKSVMENILEYQTYRFPEHSIEGGSSIQDLKNYSETAFSSIFYEILDKYLRVNIIRRDEYVPTGNGYDRRVIYSPRIVVTPMKIVGAGYQQVETNPSSASNSSGNAPVDIYQIHACPTHPIYRFQSFVGSGSSVSRTDPFVCDKRLKRFLEDGLDRHNCMGYFYSFPTGSVQVTTEKVIIRSDPSSPSATESDYRPNLVAMPAEFYQPLFGKTMITRFSEMAGCPDFYFANLDELTERWKQGGDSLEYYSYRITSGSMKGGQGVLVSYVYWLMQRISPGTDSVSLGESFQQLDYTLDEESFFLYGENRRRALDYLNTVPTAILLHSKKISPEDIQSFETLDAYREFLRAGAQDELFPYMHMWNQFNDLVAQLQPHEAEQEAPAPDAEDADKLKAYMEGDPAYEDALDVVKNYYEIFYADDETGRRLQEKYVDELLRTKYPILAYPIFPEPVYYYLKKFSEELVVPGSGDLPMDSVSVFQANTSFVESYLAGMNTEMARELLWREYPTDQRGSYFRKFWDSESSKESIKNDNFFDIKPMHTWEGKLGGNMAEGKSGLLIFALKGRLMRLYPTTRIYLWRAAYDAKTKKLDYDMKAKEGDGIMRPVMETFMNEDLLLVGFKADFYEVLGNPANKDYGYFLAFQEDVEDLDFTIEKETDLEQADAGKIADKLKNDPTIYGKHLSLFLQ